MCITGGGHLAYELRFWLKVSLTQDYQTDPRVPIESRLFKVNNFPASILEITLNLMV